MTFAKLDLQALPQLKSYWICNWFLKKDESSKVRCARDRNMHRAENTSTCSAITHRAVTALYSHVELIYDIHTYTAKAWLSFDAYTDRRDAVNRSIFRIFRSIYTQRNHIQSSNSALFTCWTHIWYTHIYYEDMIQLLHTYTSIQCSKSIDFLIFWSIYMHCKHIHCENMTQSLLIYTEWQQRLCVHAAIHIHHTYIHCKDTTQLLHIYTSAFFFSSLSACSLWLWHYLNAVCTLNVRRRDFFTWNCVVKNNKVALYWW